MNQNDSFGNTCFVWIFSRLRSPEHVPAMFKKLQSAEHFLLFLCPPLFARVWRVRAVNGHAPQLCTDELETKDRQRIMKSCFRARPQTGVEPCTSSAKQETKHRSALLLRVEFASLFFFVVQS